MRTLAVAALLALPASPSQGSAGEIDVLARIDVLRDSAKGAWTSEPGELTSPAVPHARLKLPVDVPPEYELRLTAELTGPSEALVVGLPLPGGRSVQAVFNGWLGSSCGLENVDGRPANGNETTVRSAVFATGVTRRIVCSVRAGRIRVAVDGARIIDWTGDPSRLQAPPEWAVGDKPSLFVGTHGTTYRFRRIVLEALAPGAEAAGAPSRPPPPPPPTAEEAARFRRSDVVGGPGGKAFEDVHRGPLLLAGLRLCVTPYHGGPIVKAIQPVYQAADRSFEGPWYGAPAGPVWHVVARPGYAVGGLVLRGRDRVEHLRLIFLRIAGEGLDPTDRYESEPFGRFSSAADRRLGGDGLPVVGLRGRFAQDVDAIGLVQAGLVPAALAVLRDADASQRPLPERLDAYGDRLPDGVRMRLGTLRFRDHRGVSAAAFSPDGRRIAYSGNIGPIRVVDAVSGDVLALWRVGYTPATALAWSPDGARLAAVHPDARLRVFDAATGEEKGSSDSAKESRPAWSPDGASIAVGLPDGSIAVLASADLKAAGRLAGHAAVVRSLAWSPDGRRLASGGNDRGVRLWDVAAGTGQEVGVDGDGGRGSPNVGFSPDGRLLLVRALGGALEAWDVETRKKVRTFEEREEDVIRTDFNPFAVSATKGLLAATPGPLGGLRLYRIADGTRATTLPAMTMALNSIEFSPDGARLAILGKDRALRLLDAENGNRTGPVGHEGGVRTLAWTPDGKEILSGGEEGSLRLWNLTDGKPRWIVNSLDGHSNNAPRVAMWPDGKTFVEGGGRGIRRRNLKDGTRVAWPGATPGPLPDPDEPRGYPLMISRAAGKLLAVRHDAGIHAWDLKDGAPSMAVSHGDGAAWWGLDVSPDGRRVASLGLTRGDGGVWEMGGKDPIYTFDAGKTTYWMGGAVFSPDGRLLAYSAADRSVRLLDAESGRERAALRGHRLELTSLQWSADGRLLVSTSWDGSARIWELASGREAYVLEGGEGGLFSAAFSPDGLALATGGQDMTLLIWDLARPAREGGLDAWWVDLAEADPAKARPAMAAIAARGTEGAAFLAARLAEPRPGSARVKDLIRRLDDDNPLEREAAQVRLAEEDAEDELARAFGESANREERERLGRILSAFDRPVVPHPESLRGIRTIEILERIGGPPAIAVLETLASGPDIRRTRDARAALRRLR